MASFSDHSTSVIDVSELTTASDMENAEWLMKRFVVEFREGLYTYREVKSAALIGIYVLLFVASVVGNVSVLKLVLPFRRMRSVTHYFIINLAAADLLCKFIYSVRQKKVSPKVFCDFLSNRSEFLHEISHTYYSFIITQNC